jgi:tetratricopeptide (TPR) repeat protein
VGDFAGAEGVLRQALAARPDEIILLTARGELLEWQGRLEEAIGCYRAARARRPHLGVRLGRVLVRAGQAANGRPEDAAEGAAVLRDLVGRQPNNPEMRVRLGLALAAQQDLGGAIACLRKAISLQPKYALAHMNLGEALRRKGDLEGAIACFQKAIALQPKYANAHLNLGIALYARRDVSGAIACFRKAIALDPKHATAHTNLGIALKDRGNVGAAIACLQKAVALDPKHANAHNGLGSALKAKGDLAGAIACYRKAISLEPNFAEAHCNLGHTFRAQGSFREALRYLKAGHQLGSRRTGWPYPSAAWVQRAQRLIELDARLATVLSGQGKPRDAAEGLDLAWLCQQPYKQRYAAAARLYADAFAAQPTSADDPRLAHRYNAACASALAAAGKGEGAAKLDDKQRATLRRQALDWLKADLTAWTRLLDRGAAQARPLAQRMLRHWQRDPDLAALRDKDALAGLPQDQRQAWGRLWADVADLLKRTHGPQ